MIHGLALCAGAAGLELGVELALGSEYRTVGYVERSPFVAGILAARMLDGDLAKAPIWDDLTTFDGGPWRGRVDLVSAGFPCQPFSQAGLELTTSDPRYLWDDVARVIGEAGPRIVFLENVPRLLTARFVPGDDSTRGGVFGRVLADLAALGYVGAWRTLRAADVGAPHRRERVFILAVAPDAVDWSRDKHGRSKRTNGQTATWHRTDGERGSLANPDRGRRRAGSRDGACRCSRATRGSCGSRSSSRCREAIGLGAGTRGMTADEINRRALAWEHFEWLVGMQDINGRTVFAVPSGEPWAIEPDGGQADVLWTSGRALDVPDMESAATQGCCIELISQHNARKSKADALADIFHHMGRGLSMAEAIVATMKACP